jgi:DNA-directed RNA polymerase alpha subunit
MQIATDGIPKDTAGMSLEELDLPTRIYNSLRNGGIETLGQLLATPKKELMTMRNMGGKSITIVEDKLKEKGVSLSI